MKTKSNMIMVMTLSLVAYQAFGNGAIPGRRGDAKGFVLVMEDDANGKESVDMRLTDGSLISIGYRTAIPSAGMYTGVEPDSIRAYYLKGNPDLLHIEWCDYIQGNGGHQNAFYIVCLQDDPNYTLVRGIVPMSGRWGSGTGLLGSYSIQYKGSKLSVRTNKIYRDSSRTPEPLYHRSELKNRPDAFLCSVSTTLTRVFLVERKKIRLQSTLLEYELQDGDTLQDICKSLNVQEDWVLNASLIPKGVSRIQIELPKEFSEKRYPIIDNREP